MRICSNNQLTGTDFWMSRVLTGGPPLTAVDGTPWGLSMAGTVC
jgi:hypothetical protein